MAFSFTHKGTDFTVPSFSDIPVGVIRKSRKATDDGDRAFTILETVMGEGSPELDAIDDMSSTEFQKFIEGWTQGAPMGESSSSES
jgi:hypothetical protein